MKNVCKLLFETAETLDLFTQNKKILFLNSVPNAFPEAIDHDLYQPFKSMILDTKSTYTNLNHIQGTYQLILILGTKNVKETQYRIAKALSSLEPEGTLLIAADNKENGKRLDKWMTQIGLKADTSSGHKAKCAYVKKTKTVQQDVFDQWLAYGDIQKNECGFYSCPGLFSWDRIDIASLLLIDSINEPLKGHVGDFGCGYGFLSASIKDKNPKISSLCGIDADARALACFNKNLNAADRISSRHEDLSQPYKHPHLFDFIVMNPPFHTNRKEESSLGIAFIKNAAQNLKRNGVLWMVANTQLPYEAALDTCFFSYERVIQAKGFKVIRAMK